MVQTSEMALSDTIDTSRHAADHGADAVMVLPPWLESPSERGVLYHYEQLARSVDVDIVAYNTPAASGVEITPAMFRRLAPIDNLCAIKDSQGDLPRLQKLVAIADTVKTAAELVGRTMGPLRRPQMPVTGAGRTAIATALSLLPATEVQRSRLQWREWDDELDWFTADQRHRAVSDADSSPISSPNPPPEGADS